MNQEVSVLSLSLSVWSLCLLSLSVSSLSLSLSLCLSLSLSVSSLSIRPSPCSLSLSLSRALSLSPSQLPRMITEKKLWSHCRFQVFADHQLTHTTHTQHKRFLLRKETQPYPFFQCIKVNQEALFCLSSQTILSIPLDSFSPFLSLALSLSLSLSLSLCQR